MRTLENEHPELISEWSDRNGDLKPGDISYGSNKKVWWTGKCGHIWQASVKNRSNGSSCPFCSGNQIFADITAVSYPGNVFTNFITGKTDTHLLFLLQIDQFSASPSL